jgi:AAHS family 3-hydroxyphenylpropionic acid transporter
VIAHGRALRTLLLWVSFFFGLLTLYLLLNWLPTLMVESGLSVHAAGLAQIGFNVGGALAAYLIGRCLEGRARLPSVVIAFVALPLLLYRLAIAPPELAAVVVVIFALGAALMASQAFLYAVAPACYPTVIRGLGVGLAVAIGRIGSIAGPKLGGIWKAEGLDTSHLLLKLLPIVIAGSITAIVLAYTTPREDRS